MQPLLIHLDDALRDQAKFLARARAEGAREVNAADLGARIRLWAKTGDLDALRRRLQQEAPLSGPELAFSGSGDFHHISLLLVERAIRRLAAGPITIVHFDNHPDWVRFQRGAHCGSWAVQATRIDGVEKVITIGPCSDDLSSDKSGQADRRALETGRHEIYPYRMPEGGAANTPTGAPWRSIEDMGEDDFIAFAVKRIATQSIYVTIDKDVLAPQHAVTNWDQGAASLDFICRCIKALKQRFEICGADIVGDWSPYKYDGGLGAIVLKRAESLLDQPQRKPTRDALQTNETANLTLLDCFLGENR